MPTVSHFWQLILGTVVALLPIINPLAAAPTFLAITEGDSRARQLQQLRMACIYMIAILVSFLIGGTFIMGFFGISIPGLRIAGGLMVTSIGWGLLVAAPRVAVDEKRVRDAARAKRDISFSQLARPMLSGPGSIDVTLGFTSLSTHWVDYIAIIVGIVSVAAITYATLRLSGKIVTVIGLNGMNALSKIMGFLILCVGIQFVVNGVTDPDLIRAIHNAAVGP